MKLDNISIEDREELIKRGYKLKKFNYEQVIDNTNKYPKWIHLGGGNIFRAFLANLQQELLNRNLMDTGLIIAEGYDYEIIHKIYKPNNNKAILVTLDQDGTNEKTLIESITEALEMDSKHQDFNRLKKIFSSPSLQVISLTITEKGYSLVNSKGELNQDVLEDFDIGPNNTKSYIGKLASLLYIRYINGAKPITLCSMDNISQNGRILREVILKYASEWEERKFVESDFLLYLTDSSVVSFPWTMIDKITPRPDITVQKNLENEGWENIDSLITSKNTHIAPFVNAEEVEYLVIEDKFTNGRPPLEKVGVIFSDRETVEKAEKMKVSTCLNPLHTALAIFGCLLGYKSIYEEINDIDLKRLIEKIGFQEGLPVVADPKILNPEKFMEEVINKRFSNPYIPDSPQRIATDTSQLLSVRFGITINSYINREDLLVGNLEFIPLVLAGWIRYLMGIDDEGNKFNLSPDPLINELRSLVKDFKLNEEVSRYKLDEILIREDIFGVNLFEAGLDYKIFKYFNMLTDGKGAVRKTLKVTLEKY